MTKCHSHQRQLFRHGQQSHNYSGILLTLFLTILLISKPIPARPQSISNLPSEAPTTDQINHHLQQGNNALAAGQLKVAISSYETCLDLDPNERYCIINLASALVDLNEAEAQSHRGESQKNQERIDQAQKLLRHVLSLYPNDGDASFNLALLLQDSSRSENVTREAAKLYQTSVVASLSNGEEERWDAWANMAAAKQELGEFLGRYGAIKGYERSIVILERVVNEYQAEVDRLLSEETGAGDWDESTFEQYQMEINGINAYLSKLYYGYGTILSELSPTNCLQLMSEKGTLLMDTQDGIDEISAKEVCNTNAVNAMRMAVDLDGNNAVAGHMLAAMTGDDDSDEDRDGAKAKQRASNEFVSALFDDFADTFDEKLGALGYRVPQLIGEAAYDLLEMTGKSSFHSALDAGCGTGLAGRFLRPLVEGPLVGVDLSKKMLELAAQCTLTKGCGLKEKDGPDKEKGGENENDERASVKLYDHLESLDLETASLNDLFHGSNIDKVAGFDLIVAADVLVYFGDIGKLLMNFARLANVREHDTGESDDSHLKESFLIFSCERIEDEEAPDVGWKLQSTGRYAHSKSYVERVAKEAGFEPFGYRQIVPRMERGEEVKGHMFRFVLGGDYTIDREDGDYFYSEEEGEEYEITVTIDDGAKEEL